MTQEQIEKEAFAYAAKHLDEDPYDELEAGKSIGLVYGFNAGAKWRINSVWHSPKDMMPSRNMRDDGVGELCLVETSDGCIELVQACYESINGVYYFKAYFGVIELFDIISWAYMSDLIPEE